MIWAKRAMYCRKKLAIPMKECSSDIVSGLRSSAMLALRALEMEMPLASTEWPMYVTVRVRVQKDIPNYIRF